MKCPNIFEALGRILYLIWKKGISYQGTQERATNSDALWNPGSASYTLLSLILWAQWFMKRLTSLTSQNECSTLVPLCPFIRHHFQN